MVRVTKKDKYKVLNGEENELGIIEMTESENRIKHYYRYKEYVGRAKESVGEEKYRDIKYHMDYEAGVSIAEYKERMYKGLKVLKGEEDESEYYRYEDNEEGLEETRYKERQAEKRKAKKRRKRTELREKRIRSNVENGVYSCCRGYWVRGRGSESEHIEKMDRGTNYTWHKRYGNRQVRRAMKEDINLGNRKSNVYRKEYELLYNWL